MGYLEFIDKLKDPQHGDCGRGIDGHRMDFVPYFQTKHCRLPKGDPTRCQAANSALRVCTA